MGHQCPIRAIAESSPIPLSVPFGLDWPAGMAATRHAEGGGRRPDAETLAVLAAASVYALLNALKPLHIDDPFTWYVSRQIRAAPLDPFGFEIFWWQWPQPCVENLMAPVVGYWGALGLWLAGSSDWLWKLTLLPVAALFAWALHRLARRFAPGCELFLVLITLFSPAFLPSMNYMQDVPALAVGLAALVLYLRADERRSLSLVVAAGALAGVAMQTKYTAASLPAVMFLHALLWRRPRFGIAAGLAAAAVFLAWEAFVTLRYGQGMLVSNWASPVWFWPRAWLSVPFVKLLGAALAALPLLGLAALGVPVAGVLGLGAALLAGHLLLLLGPFEDALYLASGGGALATLVAVAVALLLRRGPPGGGWRGLGEHRTELLLVGWLLVEVFVYFSITPFPALRRLLPFAVPATLLLGRAAGLAAGRRRLARVPILALQVALGLLYWAVDLAEARAQRDAARAAFHAIRSREAGGDIWFVGHWGFQHYAEALGMRPLVPDYSRVRRGDWLVVPSRIDQQEAVVDPAAFARVEETVAPGAPPRFTSLGLYSGTAPLAHASEPRMHTRIFRARRPTVPPSAWSLARVAGWATRAGGRQSAWARRALARGLARHPKPGQRILAARALGVLGPRAAEMGRAIARAARDDPDPAVRAAAAEALARVSLDATAAGADP